MLASMYYYMWELSANPPSTLRMQRVSGDKRLLCICPQIQIPPSSVPILIFILMATEQVSPRCNIYTFVAEFAIGFTGNMDVLALG